MVAPSNEVGREAKLLQVALLAADATEDQAHGYIRDTLALAIEFLQCDRAVLHEFADKNSATAKFEAHRPGVSSNLGATYWRSEIPSAFEEMVANRPVLIQAGAPAGGVDEQLAQILREERTGVAYGVPTGGDPGPTHVMTVSFSEDAPAPSELELGWVRRAAAVIGACLGTIARHQRKANEERESVRRQRLEAIGLLAGSVAHDFNNLLQAFSGIADLLMDEGMPRQEQLGYFEQLQDLSKTGAELVGSLLVFSRHDKVQRRSVDLDGVLKRFVRTIRPLTPSNIELCVAIDHGLGRVLTVASDVEQALLNVYNNAIAAMPTGGRLELSARSVPPSQPRDEWIRIEVTDCGCGMSQEVLERATEPFFTTKAAGEGTGLGLAMAQAHMRQCNGGLDLSSTQGKGTTIVFSYPKFDGSLESEAAENESYDVGGTETILVVEDDAVVRRVTRSFLTAAGYDVIVAENGEQALQTLQSRPTRARISLLITDAVMPRMGGRALYESVSRQRSGLPVIVCSGYSQGSFDDGFFEPKERMFLQKPFTRARLLKAVRQMLDERAG